MDQNWPTPAHANYHHHLNFHSPQDGAVNNEGGKRCLTRQQLSHWGSYGWEGRCKRKEGFHSYYYVSHWLSVNSPSPSLSQQIDWRAVIPISRALCRAGLRILFTRLEDGQMSSTIAKIHRLSHPWWTWTNREEVTCVCYIIRTAEGAMTTNTQWGRANPQGLGYHRQELLRGHHCTEALTILPINTSQLASGTYLFLELGTHASSCF